MKSPLTLLVSTDNLEMRIDVADILEQAGYSVLQSSNIVDALTLTRAHRPALVLLDANMLDAQGRQIVRQLKAIPELTGVLIILIYEIETAPDERAQCMADIAADGYMVYPAAHAVIVAQIDALLRLRVAQISLLDSEEKYRALGATIKDVVWTLDVDTMRFTTVTSSVWTLRGYTSEEALAQPLEEAITPQTVEYTKGIIRQRATECRAGRLSPDVFFTAEIEQPCKDGSKVWAEVVTSFWLNPNTGHVEVRGVTRDINQRKLAEMALRESEDSFRRHIENSFDIIFTLNAEGKFVFISPAWDRHFGYPSSQMLGKSFIPAIHPDDVAVCREFLERVLNTMQAQSSPQFRLRRADGSWRWFVVNGTPYFDAHGALLFNGIGRDITQLHQSEELLRKSEAALKKAQQTAHVGSWAWYIQTDHLEWSDEMFRIFGLDKETFSGDLSDVIARTIHPDDRAAIDSSNRSVLNNNKPIPLEYRIVWPDGSIRHIWAEGDELVLDEKGQPLLLTGIVQDITERKLSEEAFRANETRLNLALRASHMGVWEYDVAKDARIFDDQACRLLGMDAYDGSREMFFNAIHPEDRGLVMAALTETLEHDAQYDPEYRTVWPDGSVHHVRARGSLERDEMGRPMRISGVIWDVTDRKQVEEAFRVNEARLNLALRSAHMGAWEYDIVNDFRTFDDQAERTLGFEPGTYDGSTEMFMNALHPDDRQNIRDAFVQTVQNDARYEPEYRVIWPDGSIHYICVRGRLTRDNAGRPLKISGIGWEITERKLAEAERERLETQLRQAQKMEAVGQLAGGVAHDFNNLLQVILGHLELVQDDLEPGSPDAVALGEAHRAAERAANLTRQLLAFSRRQVIQPVNVGLNELIQDVLTMIRRIIGEHIELRFIPGERLGTINADRGQIEQVLMNLCVNARDAMRDGGTLSIKTQNATVTPEYCRTHPWAAEGQYVILSVADTGLGMDEATRAQIFEPFFTTKDIGQGTGLGLSTVYGIVKQHSGLIHVESEPGKGTNFIIHLPIVEQITETAGPQTEVPVIGGTETILVAEDEDMVRNLVVNMLRSGGYTVLAARDGEEAIRLFEENTESIHMAILDVMMPKLGGRAVMDHIQATCSNVRFLFSSGYSEDAIHSNFVIKDGLHLITKPYRREDLLRAVRATLDAPH